jgi:7-cyano-7-deazaguanine synthase
MDKAVVLLSGGLDSTALAAYVKGMGNEVIGLSFDYGQRHKRELQAAQNVAVHLGIEHQMIDADILRRITGDTSVLTGAGEVPHGHYADESMKKTVVPGRNLFFLSIAASIAMGRKCQFVGIAAHGGDHHIYPDCYVGG